MVCYPNGEVMCIKDLGFISLNQVVSKSKSHHLSRKTVSVLDSKDTNNGVRRIYNANTLD